MKGLVGMKNVMKNLNKEAAKMKLKSTKGLIECAIVIRRDMDKRVPLLPVDMGNLRASWFVTTGYSTPSKGGGWVSEKGGKRADVGQLSADHAERLGKASSLAKGMPIPVVVMGFSAHYAPFIHDHPEFKAGNRPGSGPYFFSSAVQRNEKYLVEILRKNTRIR